MYKTTSLPAVTLLEYTAKVTSMAETGSAAGRLFQRLLPTMEKLGMDVEQPTIAWYEEDIDGVEVGVGVPFEKRPAEIADLTPGELPAAKKAVVTRHTGSLEGLQQAWQDLHEHLRKEGLKPHGPCREVYVSGDMDADSWVIDLQQPLA